MCLLPPDLRSYNQHPTFTLEIQVPIESISSPSNQRIKAANSLREARERRDSGLMIIDGRGSFANGYLRKS